MRLGLHALGIGTGAKRAVIDAVAGAAERAGFATLWAGEHVVMVDESASRYPYSDDGRIAVPAEADWLDPLAVSRSAAACAEADDALNGMDSRELTRRRVLAELRLIQPGLTPRGEQLDALIEALHAGHTTTLGKVLCTGGETWTFRPAPPRRAVAQKDPTA